MYKCIKDTQNSRVKNNFTRKWEYVYIDIYTYIHLCLLKPFMSSKFFNNVSNFQSVGFSHFRRFIPKYFMFIDAVLNSVILNLKSQWFVASISAYSWYAIDYSVLVLALANSVISSGRFLLFCPIFLNMLYNLQIKIFIFFISDLKACYFFSWLWTDNNL